MPTDESRDKPSQDSFWSCSAVCILCVGILATVEYAMVMPSLTTYVESLGENTLFYGLCVGLFSFAKLSSMPVLGFWSDRRSIKEPLLVSIVINFAGNIMFACAQWAGSPWLILGSRAIVGIGAGSSSLAQAFVARSTKPEARTRILSIFGGLNMIGIVIGPATNWLAKNVEFQFWKGGPMLDVNTNPGWFMTVLYVLNFLFAVFFFKEPPAAPSHAPTASKHKSDLNGTEIEIKQIAGSSAAENFSNDEVAADGAMPENDSKDSPRKISAWGVLAALFREGALLSFIIGGTINFSLSGLEASVPAMTDRAFGWDVVDKATMYMAMGFLLASVTILVVCLSKRGATDRQLIVAGISLFACGIGGSTLFLRNDSMRLWHFVVCVALICAAVPFVANPNISLYSKHVQAIPGGQGNLGFLMGVLQSVQGLCRTAAPVFAGWALGQSDRTAAFVALGALCACCVIVMSCQMKYLNGPPAAVQIEEGPQPLPSLPSDDEGQPAGEPI